MPVTDNQAFFFGSHPHHGKGTTLTLAKGGKFEQAVGGIAST